ncbi:cytochrome b [Marinomonas algicola]|jgi:cytochrome b561|uniref:cytochrome b n=1 Tax=Marinomonas algicola TaxID=2773454 RepID=UPI00174E7173|nr:cytochrome b [Marinomonas algicola]
MTFIKHYKNTKKQFGWGSILLHWLIAFPIIGLYFLGDYMMGLTYYDSFYVLAPKIHEAIGITVLLLMLFRVVWKLLNVSPNPPASNSNFINKASTLAHLSLYFITFVILITGLLISFAGGQGLEIFDWFTIPGPAELFENQATLAGIIHEWGALGLIALVALHTLAALKHHLIDKDTTLKNMLGVEEK